ncbi:MAG TPA: branched-chain amino acid ABC transporter permease [Gaiellaceae bacterium]|nr:branched-chain amino acid ABC transporter permease [Gaiellaceae bacterium]
MRRSLLGIAVCAVAAVVLSLLPFTLSGLNQVLAAKVALYFIAILGLNIVTGYTGQISIGHGAFMAIGAYTTAIMSHDHHTNLLATLPLSFAITFGCGVLVGLPASRLSGTYLALATLALAVSLPQLTLKFSSFLGARNGILLSETVAYRWLYGVAWTCAAILFVVAWLVLRGRTGRAFRAVRDSEVAAASSGVSLVLYKTLAFGISAAFAGVAGSLFVMANLGFVNGDTFSIFISLNILIGAAVAGFGSLWGVPVGAAFVALLPNISQSAPLIGSIHGQDVAFGVVVIAVMLILPTGFAGLLHRAVAWIGGMQQGSGGIPAPDEP